VVGEPVFTLASVLAPVAQSNTKMDLGEFYSQEAANVAQAPARLKISMGMAQADYSAYFPNGVQAEGVQQQPAVGKQVTGAPAAHLFYYTAENVSAGKGTSSNIVIRKADGPVAHVFVWFAGAPAIYQNPEYARRLREIYNGGLFTSDTVEDKTGAAVKYTEARAPIHTLKMTNSTEEPWADAPVLVFEEGRAVGQVWLQYTAPGADAELRIGPAVDIRTWSAEREVKRVIGESKAAKSSSGKGDLITVEGRLQIENKRKTKAALEITRLVEGTPLAADNDAEITTTRGGGLDPTATLKWKVDVAPGEKKVLSYTYNKYVPH